VKGRLVLGGLALLAALAAAPVRAQDATGNVARAQETVDAIERLLDGIAERRANPGAQIDSSAKPGWTSLFDGESLAGWKHTEFRGGGAVRVEKDFRAGGPAIVVEAGSALSGLTWTRDVPATNYEISLESMKIKGLDFMCGLTFPVGASHASLILGGWGGNVVGISSIDGHDASENETTQGISFVTDHWYKVRMRVTPGKLEAWLDEKKIVDQDITGRKIGLRFGEISKSVPLGLATYQTSAAYRAIRLRRLEGK
jgi:hypothetical protein